MGSLSPVHWLIVIGVLALLFGSTKLPQMARSMGQSARILRAEARGMHDDEQAATASQPAHSGPQELTSANSSATAVADTQQKDSAK